MNVRNFLSAGGVSAERVGLGERKLVEGGGQSVGPSYVSALNFGSLLD